MAGADLVYLPMHARGGAVVDLDAIHPDVALTCVGILGVDRRQGDKATSVLRPALENRQMIEGERLTRPTLPDAVDDILADAVTNILGTGVDEIDAIAQELESILEALGGFAFIRNSNWDANSSTESRPSAIAMRRFDPRALIATGKAETLPSIVGFSKSSALPPPGDFISRSAISVICNSVATGSLIRRSSPASSRAFRNAV